MKEVFLKTVNMSISAGWMILAVLILRFLLKKSPKWISVLLWGIVAIRLLCPFSIESAWSLIPSAQTIPMDIEMDVSPAIDSGINALNMAVNPLLQQMFTPKTGESANPLQIWMPVFEILWILGMLVILFYGTFSLCKLYRKLATAVRYKEQIFQSEKISAPFVLGLVKPKIYLPCQLDAQDLEYVIAHEKAHICRKDHWWKPAAFLLLTIHWFNPLMWLAFVLLCRDIELACDEKVIRNLNSEKRADYTQALVRCSISRRRIISCPLAFGEVGVKTRVRAILYYKQPVWKTVCPAVLVCIFASICFLTNPTGDGYLKRLLSPSRKTVFYNDLESYRTDYLGDSVNVSFIAQHLPYPKGYKYSSIELQTEKAPYALMVYLLGNPSVLPEDFSSCADLAFDLIGNVEIISFYNAEDKTELAVFTRQESALSDGSSF